MDTGIEVRPHLQASLEGVAQSVCLADAARIHLPLGHQECVGARQLLLRKASQQGCPLPGGCLTGALSSQQ